MVSVPPPVLLQRASLAGPPTHRRRDRFHPCRQRLPAHRRLGARADPCQWPLAPRATSRPRSLRPAVLSSARRVRSVLPLEFHAGRVRHGSGVPLASHPETPLSTAFPAGHPHCQSRTLRHLPRPQDHCPTRPRDRQSIRNADRGTCVRHRFGKSSIKIYDKFGLVLRLETTTNDVSAFKHYRKSLPPRRRGGTSA